MFATDAVQQAAQLIPRCTLRLYPDGFCLAAVHPDRFGHIVIAGAGLWGQRPTRQTLSSPGSWLLPTLLSHITRR